MNLKIFKNSKYPNGFTLAEVLITLVIIGVIAAMTIPALINNIQQKQYIVAWRKSFSDVAQAALLVKAHNDSFDDIPGKSTEQEIVEKLAQYMSQVKICHENKFIEEGCGADYKVSTYNANSVYGNGNYSLGNVGGGAACMVLNNGTYLCFDSYIAIFDVNGNRGPNMFGRDIFFALLDRDNFVLNPAVGQKTGWGAADGILQPVTTSNPGTCQTEDLGYGCSAWYLLHDK